MSSTLTETTSTNHPPSRPPPLRSLRKASSINNIASKYTASSPNLNNLYNSSSSTSRLAPPATSSGLARKGSLAALTLSSLAAIPDASETYAFNSVLSDDPNRKMTPTTPGRSAAGGDDLVVGDAVDVPGGMYGTVRFVGNVDGKKGAFVGVELHHDFAGRGKNSGDVDG